MAELSVTDNTIRILKRNEAQRYTLGVVYEPNVEDTDGEFASGPDIEAASWRFMKSLQHGKLTQKALEIVGAFAKSQPVRVDVTDTWEDLEKIGSGLGDMHSDWSEDLGTIVENYLAPVDFTLGEDVVRKGTWLLGVVWSPDHFQKIITGKRTGYSMGGKARREEIHA